MAADDQSPEEELHDDDETQGDDPDEGSGEGDGDESDGSEGEAGDEESGEADTETDDGQEGSGDVDAEPPAKPAAKSLSQLHRQEKAGRKEAARRAEEAQRRADEAERRAADADRRAQEAERRAAERRETQSAEEEARRLEVMSETERSAYYREKDRKDYDSKINGLQRQMWDSSDRAEFRDLCREDPLFSKVRDEVDKEFQRLWNQGSPVSRKVLAELQIGRLTVAERRNTATRQRERGAERLKREAAKPPRTRSQVPAERSKRAVPDSREARRKRLEDVEL